ncbi:hypothetical protein LTR94_035438, partial [Friedmanniomyces endolithicus]
VGPSRASASPPPLTTTPIATAPTTSTRPSAAIWSRAWRRRPRACRPNGSMMRAGQSYSRPSPACRNIIRPGRRRPCCGGSLRTGPTASAPTPFWSSWVRAPARRRASCWTPRRTWRP